MDLSASCMSYSIHGLKSTLLSWSQQLMVPKEQRLLQGHHVGLHDSSNLYGRDDISGALALQGVIIDRVRAGWRPVTPLGRGSQHPWVEPSFKLESFAKLSDSTPWRCFVVEDGGIFDEPASHVTKESAQSDSSSDDSSSSSSASGSIDLGHALHPSSSCSWDGASFGTFRSTWHVVIPAGLQDDVVSVACGRKFSTTSFETHSEFAVEHHHLVCSHPGCKKGWSSLGLL